MFIDTSGWFCIFDLRDNRHTEALSLYGSADSRVTHSFVLAEFVALTKARKGHRSEMLEFLSNLMGDAEINVVWVDEALNYRAVELLKRRLDKSWSLCDAVSFILMNDRQISEALTTDRDFEQAGFVKLLRSQ